MKIEDLKLDDKLICTKTLETTQMIFRNVNHLKRRQYLLSKKYKELTKEEKVEKKNFDFRYEETYNELIKNNTYYITHKSENEITITAERQDIMIRQNKDVNNIFKTEEFLNEYFTTEKETRKNKLDTISDNNFNSFLKKIKK